MTRPNQGLSSLAPGGGKMRDPGNEVDMQIGKLLMEMINSSSVQLLAIIVPFNNMAGL